MCALRIPTTRSLSLISLPKIPVHRERLETACVTSRVSPSFIRIGSFESHNGPEATVVYLFSPQTRNKTSDWEGLRKLGEWVSRRVLHLETTDGGKWGLELVKECARRNARMVAGWQAYGFMVCSLISIYKSDLANDLTPMIDSTLQHGVMNTDNISIAGLTLDYGPYAFMDVYNVEHICNHTDEEGRYAFKASRDMLAIDHYLTRDLPCRAVPTHNDVSSFLPFCFLKLILKQRFS